MRWFRIRLSTATLAFVALSVLSTASAFACQRVQGHLEETPAPPASCLSPVGLCTVAQVFGNLKGEAHFTAANIIVSGQTPTTGVVFVIGDSVLVDARLGSKQGTLISKNAAAFQSAGEGDLVDVQTIVGGTGDFIDATGSLRISGNFLPATGGISSFEGTVCLP